MGLLNIPFLPQELILKNMRTHQIFLLSFASKRTKQMIRSMRWKAKGIYFDICTVSERVNFALDGWKKDDKTVITWSFEKPPYQIWRLPPILLKFDGMLLQCSLGFHSTTGLPTIWCDENVGQMLPMSINQHASDLFRVPSDIQLLVNPTDIEYFPHIGIVKNCDVQGPILDSDELKNLFDNLKVSDCIIIRLNLKGYPNNPLPYLKVNHLAIKDASFIAGQRLLLGFKGIHGEFNNADVNNLDVRAFLKCWMKGKNTKLESIIARKNPYATHGLLFEDSILNDFQVKPWDLKRRPAIFHYKETTENYLEVNNSTFDCTNEVDIEREADGALATVIITRFEFKFFVWKESIGKSIGKNSKTRKRIQKI